MTPTVLHLISISAKIALLGGLAWLQLYLVRRAPARLRSRVCSLALIAMLLIAAGEMLVTPRWLAQGPVFHLAGTASGSASQVTASTHLSSWLTLLWMAGVVFLSMRAAAGRVALARLRRTSTAQEKFCGLEVRAGEVETPILTGLLRPAILLPASAQAWGMEQRRMVLTHELTHFRQGDCWSNLLAQALCGVFWFHPVVWLLAARMSREQELACDEAVVSFGHSRHDYAAFLLQAARNLRSHQMFACAMAGSGARSMKQRFANLLDGRPRLLSRRMAVSLAVFAALAVTLAIVRPVWSQGDEGKVYKADGRILLRELNGVVPPKVLYKTDPPYTPEDRAAKISGTVLLKIIVTPEGKADHIRVVRSLTPGLDNSAVETVSQWIFQPATKDGKAVSCYATVQVNFRLL